MGQKWAIKLITMRRNIAQTVVRLEARGTKLASGSRQNRQSETEFMMSSTLILRLSTF